MEFLSLVESLKEMSRRWQGTSEPSTALHGGRPQHGLDLAGQYAAQLENFHTIFLRHPGHCMNVLGYVRDPFIGSIDCLLPFINSRNNHVKQAYGTNQFSGTRGSENESRFEATESSFPRTARISESMNAAACHASAQPLPETGSVGPPRRHPADVTHLSAEFDSSSVEDELTAMSNVLLGQQFLEMDRVITLNDTNFAIDLDGWPRIG